MTEVDRNKLHQICWQELQLPGLTYEQSSDLASRVTNRLLLHYSIRPKREQLLTTPCNPLDLASLSDTALAQVMNSLNPANRNEDFASEGDRLAFHHVSYEVGKRWVDKRDEQLKPPEPNTPEFDQLVDKVTKWVASHQGQPTMTFAVNSLLLALIEDVKWLAKKEAERG